MENIVIVIVIYFLRFLEFLKLVTNYMSSHQPLCTVVGEGVIIVIS